MKIADEFLSEKADAALGAYFRYLAPGLKIVRTGAVTTGSASEKRLLARYNHGQPRFQARASTLVLEAFHAVELILKAALSDHGEHLVFESLDDYLDRCAAAPKVARKRQERIEQLQKSIAGALRTKKGPPKEAYQTHVKHLMRAPVADFGRSVSAQVAFKRLLHFEPQLRAALPEETLTRLVGLRNQIVHFGEMANLLDGIVDALRCLFALCQWRPQRFPRLAKLPSKYSSLLPAHNEMMQHMMLHEAWPRILESATGVSKHMLVPQE